MFNCFAGFNGQISDQSSSYYHPGNGYRPYNSSLLRFVYPDSLSPFSAGGINPYAYCVQDPVNRSDPSGHMSWQSAAGIVLGGLGLAMSIFTAGSSILAAGSVLAAIESSTVASLVVGVAGAISDATAIVSGAVETNPTISSALGWMSLATGLIGIAAGSMRFAKGLMSSERASGEAMRETILQATRTRVPPNQFLTSFLQGNSEALEEARVRVSYPQNFRVNLRHYESRAYDIAQDHLGLPPRTSRLEPDLGSHRRIVHASPFYIPVYSRELRVLAPLPPNTERTLNRLYETMNLSREERSFHGPSSTTSPVPPRYAVEDPYPLETVGPQLRHSTPPPGYLASQSDDLLDYNYDSSRV